MAINQEGNLITLEQSYDTMVEFIEIYYKIGLCESDDIRSMLSSLTRHKENGDFPFDITLWEDYMRIAESKIISTTQ